MQRQIAQAQRCMAMDVEKELKELRRRVDLAETRLSQPEGRFEFISGQLRDIQLYLHARFEDIDTKLDVLRAELPDLVASAVGSALRNRD